MTMNNKASFDEILHGYTISQAAQPFFVMTFKDFFPLEDKGNTYLTQKSSKGMHSSSVELTDGSQMNFKNETSDISRSLQSASDVIRFVWLHIHCGINQYKTLAACRRL